MIERRKRGRLQALMAEFPAVAVLGPRQVGKTTLAHAVASDVASVYLDLESPADRNKLRAPELYLADHAEELIVFDEVHRQPDLFEVLRGDIDRGRRAGRRTGRFLLLGSASMDLLRQSGESLAGRIAYLDLGPFDALEVDDLERLWVRGGFPDSYLAASERASVRWRENFIRTYLQRDVPEFGPRIAAETLRRFWTMLAHQQGGLLNASSLARGLGVSSVTVANYLDLLVDLLLVRRLPPWFANTKKRLVKSPRVYLRDSGICHTLLGISSKDALLAHPVAGGSWEGFVIENLIAASPEGAEHHFYRTSAGAEIDLVISLPGDERWAVEIKRSASPKPERGFHNAREDIGADRSVIVYPGQESYRIAEDVEVVGVRSLCEQLAAVELT